MFKAKLISTDISYNYVEKGDRLYLTAKFQNVGDTPLDCNAQIAADVVFCNRHRREQNQNNNFRFNWKPFPEFNCIKSGEVWSTTGTWLVPQTWGASYEVRISIVTNDGQPIAFLGADGKEVYSQCVAEIDLGWGWGRGRLLEQRRKLHADFNEVSDMPTIAPQQGVAFGDYTIGANYPQFLGYKGEKWLDIVPYITERNIDTNKTEVLRLADITSSLKSNDGTQAVYSIATANTSADIVIKTFEDKITVGVENLKQNPSYELCSVVIPNVAQSAADDAIMTNYFGGGRELKLKDTLPQSIAFIYDTCNALTAGNKDLTFCVNANDADNILIQSVAQGKDGKNIAVIGINLVVNMPANKVGMRSIPIEVVPIEIYAVNDASWKTSALILQKQNPDTPNEVYKDTFVYKIDNDSTAQINPDDPNTWHCVLTTLNQTDEQLEKICNISDDMSQVVYLVGWQTGGHDFLYPYPYRSDFNPRMGTAQQFKDMQDKYLKRNVSLSFHDNFDDAYLSDTYEIDKEILAYDENGNPYKGWLWSGGMSYIVCPHKYSKTAEIDNRIAEIIKQYQIDKIGTYHLDVMTSENRRYDFTQDNPSSARMNMEAKKEIVKKFNDLGIDITSETVCLPFLGTIGFFHGIRCLLKDELFFGDRFVPLTTLAMHGAAPYLVDYNDDRSLLNSIFLGSSFGLVKAKQGVTGQNVTEEFYLHFLPMSKFTYTKVTDIDYNDTSVKVYYGADSYTFVNFADNSYEIVKDGKKISWNYNTVADYKDKYYVFSRNGGSFDVELGEDWSTATVYPLSEQGRGEATVLKVENGKITVNASAGVPYVIVK